MDSSNVTILAYEETPLGVLCLRKRNLLQELGATVTEITLNHEFLMSSHHTDSERALASIAIEMHKGKELNLLIGGLGLGYTAYESLRCDLVHHVEVVEFLKQVIGWMERGLIPLGGKLKADRRLRVAQGDIYARLSEIPKKQFDMILIDVDHSPDERLDTKGRQFYTREGLIKAKKHLAEGGVLGVWSYAKNSAFASALDEVFPEVRIEPVCFKHKFLNDEKHTDWLFFARK